jgi:hypothetical protein
VKSKTAFWLLFGKPPFGALLKRSRRRLGKEGNPFGGAPHGVAGQVLGLFLAAPLILFPPFYALEKVIFVRTFLVFPSVLYPLGFPINRR